MYPGPFGTRVLFMKVVYNFLGKVTAKDVAKRAGVSETTVSMILNGKSGLKFPERTCRRVMDACNELGYMRNVTRINTSGEKTIVAIAPSFSNWYYIQLVESMQQRAKELGYALMVFNTFREVYQETHIMQICGQLPVSGMLVLYPPENTLLLQQIGWEKPVVHIYDKNSHSGKDVFEVDGFQIGKITAEHLIELGHERIALISSTFETKQTSRIHRLKGLRAAYEEHGYDPLRSVLACSPEQELPDVKTPPEGYELGYIIAKRLIERGEDVTAFVAVNDVIGVGVMDAITDAGRHIPEDYSVCGCDNTNVCKYRGISMTSVESYAKQTGREAVDVLVHKIESGNTTAELEDSPDGITRVEYFPKLIARRSTGPRRGLKLP